MTSTTLTAFASHQKIASGDLRGIAATLKALVDTDPQAQILIFDDHSGSQVDLNLHGSLQEVLQRLPMPRAATPAPATDNTTGAASMAPRSAGRPKLGVVAREVTLLPRHWDWLASQPGGSSVALRKLVEQAQRDNREADAQRMARDAAYKFISAMAGDEAGFEEACRALFAGDKERYETLLSSWPDDVREHAIKIAAASFIKGI